MSREITIAISGASAGVCSAPLNDAAVSAMQKLWAAELEHFGSSRPDLIVLPECCDRFKEMTPLEYRSFCQFRKDAMLKFFQEQAEKYHTMIAYCANWFDEAGNYRNRVQLIGRRGEICGFYDKNYPTAAELQIAGIVPGEDTSVIDCELGRIGFAICFDLNFDTLFDKYAKKELDLLLFSSVYHGGPLQVQRSRECGCYFLGAVSGERCTVVDPQGEVAASSSNYIPRLCTTLDLDCAVVHYDNHFEKLEKLKAKYGRDVMIRDPGRVGTVLVTSKSSTVSVREMLTEFGIIENSLYIRQAEELADQYRSRSRE
ncbi:MAG: carbon-nitrogen hydrolase family protein [Lentisphaeria bacterium]|nr:carbon-nitrogen hydrolase family protein [Lentisphaeria bacterium]